MYKIFYNTFFLGEIFFSVLSNHLQTVYFYWHWMLRITIKTFIYANEMRELCALKPVVFNTQHVKSIVHASMDAKNSIKSMCWLSNTIQGKSKRILPIVKCCMRKRWVSLITLLNILQQMLFYCRIFGAIILQKAVDILLIVRFSSSTSSFSLGMLLLLLRAYGTAIELI